MESLESLRETVDTASTLQEQEEQNIAASFCLLLLLVAGVVWLSHLVRQSKLKFITLGSLALIIGLISGGLLYAYFQVFLGKAIPRTLVAFQYEVYMDLLLPPIIFYAGFSIKKKAFFSNFGALVTLGVFGTIISAVVVALLSYFVLIVLGLDDASHVSNSLALGVVMSSSDSVAALQALSSEVHPQLHSLVFGEAVVNDATAIVLLRAIQKIHSQSQLSGSTLFLVLINFFRLSVLSLLLGVMLGLITAFILKTSFWQKHSTDREVSLLAALGFMSYLAAESLGLSGVFAVFFCGLTQSHYAWHSLSPSAKVVSVYAFRVMSFLAELMLFLSSGLDIWSSSLWEIPWSAKSSIFLSILWVTVFLSFAVVLARFAVITPLVELINVWRPEVAHISGKNCIALCLAGCARGAVTLALAVNHFLGGHDNITKTNRILSAACILTVVLSTVFLGGIIPLLFDILLKSDEVLGHDASTNLSFKRHASVLSTYEDYPVLNVKGLKKRWKHVDYSILQPIFGGRTMVEYHSPPPSPGRWRGPRSAIHVLKRAPEVESRVKAPARLSNDLSTPFLTEIDEDVESNLPPGSPAHREESEAPKNTLERLFSHPGEESESEDLVDGEVQIGGVLQRAETLLRDQEETESP
eukprot:jgi/Picsp_1/450/NSC_00448-R1_sodium hydrogen